MPGTNERQLIDDFLSGNTYAVVGASSHREKYGNKVLRAYMQQKRIAYPVNPNEKEVEGMPTIPDLMSLPGPVHGASIITQPEVTERIVEDAAKAGIRRLWMQPGAENAKAVKRAGELGLSVISGGPCVLVALRYRE